MPPEKTILEQRLAAALRALPDREAPAALEERVMAELARRAALPWWHRSYQDWPRMVQVLFVPAAAALVMLAMAGSMKLMNETLPSWLAHPLAVWDAMRIVVTSLVEIARDLMPDSISPWLYAAMAAIGAAYALCFGLGAAAYRFLWKKH